VPIRLGDHICLERRARPWLAKGQGWPAIPLDLWPQTTKADVYPRVIGDRAEHANQAGVSTLGSGEHRPSFAERAGRKARGGAASGLAHLRQGQAYRIVEVIPLAEAGPHDGIWTVEPIAEEQP
jgi:hypothetical protein